MIRIGARSMTPSVRTDERFGARKGAAVEQGRKASLGSTALKSDAALIRHGKPSEMIASNRRAPAGPQRHSLPSKLHILPASAEPAAAPLLASNALRAFGDGLVRRNRLSL